MKYVSLFAGIGGFDLALNRLGHECVYVNEWDKYAAEIYEKNFKHKPDTTDITLVRAEEIPDHQLLVGGFPCQSFSVAGKRKGFEDTRGTLFFDIARILAAKRPAYLLLENVKGLLSHDSGRTFQTIMRTLDELGYDTQWQVLNSKNFGVPQNRERVFIVGHLRGEPGPKIFPIGQDDGISNAQGGADRGQPQAEISGTVRRNPGKADDTYIKMLTERRTPEAKAIRREMMKKGKDWSPRRGKELVTRNDDKANTITAGQSKEQFMTDGSKIRRLTPIECERLQGFPDNWTEGVSDTQRYKMLGNAVTVNVVYEVARRLKI
jgi:DNA (cytosine-5)-methyltransferase 1